MLMPWIKRDREQKGGFAAWHFSQWDGNGNAAAVPLSLR